MPKNVNYPRCSFDDAIEFVEKIDSVGGKATIGFIAESLGMQEKGGGFQSKVNGVIKYGLISRSGQDLKLTQLADSILHPIDDSEKQRALFKSFTSVPLFAELINQLKGKCITKDTLISMLIRMYDVNRNAASKVAWYFLKANSKYDFMSFTENEPSETIQREETEANSIDSVKEANTSIPEKVNKTTPEPKQANSINQELFDMLLHLGNILHNSNNDSKRSSISEIKKLLKENNSLSHLKLIVDLVSVDSAGDVEKLKDAVKIDLGLQ